MPRQQPMSGHSLASPVASGHELMSAMMAGANNSLERVAGYRLAGKRGRAAADGSVLSPSSGLDPALATTDPRAAKRSRPEVTSLSPIRSSWVFKFT